MSAIGGVRSLGQRLTDNKMTSFSRGATPAVQVLLIMVMSGILLWLVWIYGNGLRDPRYFDGWVLAGGMIFQLLFHIAVKVTRLSPASVKQWRKFHIFVGYVLIAAFISHSDFSLPDTGFEWALWLGFVLVALSGILSTYLSWSLSAKRDLDNQVSYDLIPARRAELAQDVHNAVTKGGAATVALALPAPAYEAWITDLYNNHLHDFFQGQRNFIAHVLGSQKPVKRLIEQIDNLSGYVDAKNQEKLYIIRDLVVEKDKLDFARAYFGLSRGSMFVHVPVTYALIVMTILHVVVAYSFSSGDW